MLRMLVLSVLLALGACAPSDPRLYAGDLAEKSFGYFEPVPPGTHACPPGSQGVGRMGGEYVELLCVRFNEERRPERHGPVERFDRFGRRTLEGQYEAGLRTGTWSVYRDDESSWYALEYERGVIANLACPEGRLLTGTRNGQFYWCGAYRRAVRDGPEYHFRPATMRFQALGSYAEGHKHGTWVWWDESGQISKIEQWALGTLYWKWVRACDPRGVHVRR